MATEEQANLARDIHGDRLRKMGAHGITVDQVGPAGDTSFAVVAFVEKPQSAMPQSLSIKTGNQSLNVPLIVKVAEKFKPE